MNKRTDYKDMPRHLQLDENRAKCPCGKKTVAQWIETPAGKMLGFECEVGHLFEIDIRNHVLGDSIKTIYVNNGTLPKIK